MNSAGSVPLTTSRILRRCRELGFALAGVCDARPSDYGDSYQAWIEAGQHGEMSYLARNVEMRLDPRKLMPGARSIICVGDRYWNEMSKRHYRPTSTPGRRNGARTTEAGISSRATAGTSYLQAADAPSSPLAQREGMKKGRIARYARGDDYHKAMKKRLQTLCDELRAAHTDHTFRACVDTAPVMEREHAQRAGLGAVGKHTLLIERGIGSYFFIGEIITTLPLTASKPADPDPCGECTRCIDACPTDAITPWSVDATKCISYLTIEHRSDIDPALHEAMGDWIFGCDICQEVCPHNTATRRSKAKQVNPSYAPRRDGFDLLEVLNWTEDDRRAAFAGSAMKRAKLEMMQRNAQIAMLNEKARG